MMKINTKEIPVFTNKELAKATKRIVTIGTRIQKNLYEVAHILADVDARGLYKDDGFKSVVDYAEIQKFVKSIKAESEGGGDGEGGDAVEEAMEEFHQAAAEVLDELETLKQALFSAMGQLVDYMGAAEAGKIVTEYYNELAAKEVKESELVSE